MTEEELVASYEEIMNDYQRDDEWDLPAALFIRWDTPEDIPGCIIVIPTEDPKEFLEMLVAGEPLMAQAIFRQIGDVPEDTPIAALALINEGWGLDPDNASKEDIRAVEAGTLRISDSLYRIETRLCFVVTKDKGVYFGSQDRGKDFAWISRSDEPASGAAGGLLPYLLYPLVTGEPYEEPEALHKHKHNREHQDLRYSRGKEA